MFGSWIKVALAFVLKYPSFDLTGISSFLLPPQELDQAEYISMESGGSHSSGRSPSQATSSSYGHALSNSESSVPGWLKNV